MSLWRRRKPGPFDPQERFNGLSQVELNTLGTYNAERGRGVVHAAEWQAEMAVLQARFDAAERERLLQHRNGARYLA